MAHVILIIYLSSFLFACMMALNGRSKKLPKPALKLPPTSSQLPLEPTRIFLTPVLFKKGELVELTYFAQILCIDTNIASVGIIMSNARNCSLRSGGDDISYWVYDVFVGSELVTDIPQDFMKKVKNYENEEDFE